jgi:hypothetical protein
VALTERLALLVTLDAQGAIKGLESVGKAADRNLSKADTRMDKLGQNFQKAGAGMLAGAGLAAVGLYKAGQSAADLEQAVGGTEAVFKDASGTIDRFAQDSAKNMGLSERAFREATTSIGGQLKALGFNQDEAADKAVELTGVAADLAATYGGTTAEAVQALGAAFRGEADPAERFNLRLNQNTVNAKAVELGLAATTSQVDAQAKAQATLALITEQSADAQGQFAREAGSAAGSMAIANAEFEDAKASLGQSVAPIMATIAGGLADVAGGFSSVNEKSDGFVSKLATIGTIGLGAAGGLSLVVGKVITMRENLGPLISKLRGTEGGLSRLGKVAGGVGAAFALFELNEYRKSLDDVEVNVEELAAALGTLGSANRAQLDEMVTLTTAAGTFDDVVSDTADTNIAAATRLIDYAEANGLAADEVERLRGIVKDKQQVDIQATEDQAANTAAVDAAVGPTGELTEATGGLTDAVSEAAEAYDDLLDSVLAQADADLAFREAMDSTRDALDELAEKQAAAAAAGGKNKEANEELEDALFNAEGALYDQANAAVAAAEKQAELEGKTLSAADKQAILVSELSGLRDFLAPGNPLRKHVQAAIDKLNELATDRSATVSIQIREQRIALTQSRDEGGRAAGGAVNPHSTYLVGERGPELLTLGGRGGHITPNSQLRGGGGGGQTIVIQVGDRVIDELVVDSLGRVESRNGAVRVRTRAA